MKRGHVVSVLMALTLSACSLLPHMREAEVIHIRAAERGAAAAPCRRAAFDEIEAAHMGIHARSGATRAAERQSWATMQKTCAALLTSASTPPARSP